MVCTENLSVEDAGRFLDKAVIVSSSERTHTDLHNDWVEEASIESFPASDSPSWTPTTGIGDRHTTPGWQVMTVQGRQIIDVAYGRGEELRLHLQSHAISTHIVPGVRPSYERLEVDTETDPEVLRALVDQWEH
jgi:hypothetical protein